MDRLHHASLVQIRHFVAVADEGSIIAAARALGAAQSAVSASVKRLEETLDAVLFERRAARGTTLTADGRDVYELANRIVADCEALARWGRPRPGQLPVIGCLQSLTPAVAAPLLRRLRAHRVKAMLMEGGQRETAEWLDKGKCDMLLSMSIAGLPSMAARSEDFAFEEAARSPIVAIAHASHPIARHTRATTSQLLHYPLAMIEDSLNTQFVRYLSKSSPGLPLRTTGIKTIATLNALIEAGTHIGFAPLHLAFARGQTSRAKVVTTEVELPAARLGIAWRKDQERNEEFEKLKLAAAEAIGLLVS